MSESRPTPSISKFFPVSPRDFALRVDTAGGAQRAMHLILDTVGIAHAASSNDFAARRSWRCRVRRR